MELMWLLDHVPSCPQSSISALSMLVMSISSPGKPFHPLPLGESALRLFLNPSECSCHRQESSSERHTWKYHDTYGILKYSLGKK